MNDFIDLGYCHIEKSEWGYDGEIASHRMIFSDSIRTCGSPLEAFFWACATELRIYNANTRFRIVGRDCEFNKRSCTNESQHDIHRR